MRIAPLLALAMVIVACDKSSSSSNAAPSASAPAPAPSPAPASASASASAAPSASAAAAGPNDLTPERRAKIESAIPEAKGFADAKDMGRELIDDANFVKSYGDALTKKSADGWILFRGTMNDLQKDSFALAMMIAEVDPNSPIGAPKVVVFRAKDIKGYDPSKYQPGDYGAIVAKFAGGAKIEIKPGFDAKALNAW